MTREQRNNLDLAMAGALFALGFALAVATGARPGSALDQPSPVVVEQQTSSSTSLPTCAEDVVLVGIGDFVNGRWEAYVCGPARDDYGRTR